MGRKRSERYEAGRFGIILSILLLIIASISWWKGHGERASVLSGAAGLALLLTLTARALWIRFYRIWMRVVGAIGRIVTLALLTSFFFLVLTPYGWILRLAGRRAMDLEWKEGRPTFWIEKTQPDATAERYRRPF